MVASRPAAFTDDLSAPLALMKSCFPQAPKYTSDYLRWLYLDNPDGQPVGIQVFDGSTLKAQIVGIPQRIVLQGRPAKVILLLDVAVHESLRGQGVYLRGVTDTEELARSLGYDAVIGVANFNTYRGYEKLNYQNVAGLGARISPLSYFKLDAVKAVADAQFYRDWTDDTLTWRMANPINPLSCVSICDDVLTIDGRTNYPGLVGRARIPRRNLSVGGPKRRPTPRPSLVLSLEPSGTASHLAMSIPERLKPSPLRLIYKNLHDGTERLNPSSILFSFLDFDPF